MRRVLTSLTSPTGLRTCLAVLALGLAPAAAPGQISGLSDLDPFNRNSAVRKGLLDVDPTNPNSQTRRGASDLERYLRERVRVVENWGSEQGYFGYRNHVLSRNQHLRYRTIDRNSMHGRMIYPVLGGRMDVDDVRFFFDAYVPGNMAAVTFGNRVYVDASYRPNDIYQGLLLAHELTHAMQFERLGGENKFARRYWGQIWEQIRRGNADTHLIHDSMGLEREASDIEKQVGRRTFAGVRIHNRTNVTVHYSLERERGGSESGQWSKFSLAPGKVYTHSMDLEHYPVDFSIRFDEAFRDGVQRQVYDLDPGFTINRTAFDKSDATEYHFVREGNTIDLRTGAGSPGVTRRDGPTQRGASSLRVGQPTAASLGASGSNRHGVYLRGGQTYTITVNKSSGNLDPRVKLLSPGGQQVGFDDDGGTGQNSRLVYRPSSSGAYSVVVDSYDTTSGRYVVEVEEGGSSAGRERINASRGSDRLSVGRPHTDSLGGSDRDRYSVNLSGGRTYTVTADRTSGNLDPRLWVRNANGQQLGFDDDGGTDRNSRLRFRAPSSGTYYVEVDSFSDTSGGYRLEIE